jgi:hypothetical protein
LNNRTSLFAYYVAPPAIRQGPVITLQDIADSGELAAARSLAES